MDIYSLAWMRLQPATNILKLHLGHYEKVRKICHTTAIESFS